MATPEDAPEPQAAGVEDIIEDIENTRRDVVETVSALTDKLDVKARVQDKAVETRERIVEAAETTRHEVAAAVTGGRGSITLALPAIAALATTITLLGVIAWRRRHQGATS